jgi:hypothetical protein
MRLPKGFTKTPDEVSKTSVRPFKSNSLALCIVIALLGMIVVVLILPDVDLPDTAFQRNSSLQTLRALSHQVPHAGAYAGSFHLSFQFKDASIPLRQVQENHAQCSSDLAIQHKSLRC